MALTDDLVAIRFEWTGTGTGDVTAGAASDGFRLPPAGLVGQTVSYEIRNPSAAAERENGRANWNGTILERSGGTVIFPTGGAVNFGAGTKLVSITPLPQDINSILTAVQYQLFARVAAGSGAASPLGRAGFTDLGAPALDSRALGFLADGTLGLLELAIEAAADGIVTIGDGAVISGTSHGAVSVNGQAIRARTLIFRHATDPTQPVAILVGNTLARTVQGVVAGDQTGAVTIQRESAGSINGLTTAIQLAGPYTPVSILPSATPGQVAAAGDFVQDTTLRGALIGNGQRIYGYRNRKYGALSGAQTLSAANFASGSKLINTGAAATYTLPSRLTASDTGAEEELKVRNGGSGAITWSASGVTLVPASPAALAAGETAVLSWEHDGTTERVEVRATA